MRGSEKVLLTLLLLTTLFKGIVWAGLIPMWHAPDEQAHFAQVQYFAEMREGIKSGNDLSQEVYESELLLGTLRDELGINRFTYHPEYRIQYSDTLVGIHEEAIAALGHEKRTAFVKQEAARYPPLFYIISTLGYFAGYGNTLFVRVFLTRMVPVILAVMTVWFSYLLASSVFPKQKLLSIGIASLISFQPMLTFVTSGVNNDSLLILLTTILLWLMVDALRSGVTARHAIGMGITLGLGILTKQLIYPFIPLPLTVMLYWAVRKRNTKLFMRRGLPFLLSALAFGGILFVQQWAASGSLPFWPQVSPESGRYSLTILQYLSEKIPQLYRETLPWYWGVFKWLGVVLPINILRAIKVVLALSLVGLVQYAVRRLRSRTVETVDWQLLLLAFTSFWYAFWLFAWDYMLIRSIGFSHGIQGRNFFPTIAAHLTLVAFGLWNLTRKHRRAVVVGSVLSMISLNFIALRTMLASYYDLTPLHLLLTQASQYKPWFFKDGWLIFWFVMYLTALANYLQKFVGVWRKR